MACMSDNRNAYGILVTKPESQNNIDDLRVDERTVLLRILKKYNKTARIRFIRISIRVGTSTRLL